MTLEPDTLEPVDQEDSPDIESTRHRVISPIKGVIQSRLSRYIAKKIGFALVTYFIAITVVFFLYHVLPGNPVNVFAGDPRVSPEVRDELISRWGLDEPLWKQYLIYMANLLRGDLGYSFIHKTPVSKIIGEALPWTLLLLGLAFIINAFVGIFLGAFIAWRRGGKLDTSFVLFYNVYNSIPLFFVGMLFIAIFGFQARINGWSFYFPIYGAIDPQVKATGTPFQIVLNVLWHLTLPLLVLILYGVLSWSWFMRGNLIQILTEDYIQTAKAKGLSDNEILFQHGMPNALLPVVTAIGLDFGALIGGNVLIETVFSYPGTGYLLYEALLKADYPLVQGSFIIIAGLTLLGLLVSEIMYGFLDPRIKTD